MLSKYFENFESGVMPIIVMVMFLLVFIGIVIWAVKADKKYIKKMSNMPLDSNKENKNNGNNYGD